MIQTPFGTSPELLLQIFATRNAEDIARAERAHLARAARAKQSARRRWVGAIRFWADRLQHVSAGHAPSRRRVWPS